MKIIMVMVQTADGKVAKNPDETVDWSCPEDKLHFKRVTTRAGVVIMGRKTFSTLKKPLAQRLNLVLTGNPENYENIPGKVEFMKGEPRQIVEHLEKRGYKTAILAGGVATNVKFLEAQLVDQIAITQENLIFGQGVGFCDGLNRNLRLKLLKLEYLNRDVILLNYKVIY
ncbi:MAG: dihydrofolate reductase family protein [Vulcanimicrobiota bacterium]